ncbi:hypothetical protein [Bacillus sp. AN2]|uniref:hypothetical protein n=1 Tax=Bacillus sp. AN2 TaxID=1572696 RepID=UPI00132BFD91|nr:hypothetical protein [Bacillus sp. AN2]MXP79345.1 hypothetical protein [Bacillus sp. AN2]
MSIISFMLALMLISIVIYAVLRKTKVVDEAPGAIAEILLILLIFFSISFVIIIPSSVLYVVSLGVNFLFGEYITYASFLSLLTFCLFVSGIVLFWSIFFVFIGKGISSLLRFPQWFTFIFEFLLSWIVVHFSIKFVLNMNIVNVSIWEHGTLILSFFVSFLFIGIDLIYSSIEQRKQPLDEQAKSS